jgi:hypothetical protein
MSETIASTTAPTPAVQLGALRVLAVLLLLGVLLQSFFAGGFLRGTFSWALTAHEIGANATFGVLLLEGLLVLATPAFRRNRALLGGLVAIGVVLTAIIGLGYVGGDAVTAHVPLGVLVAIAVTHHVQSVFRAR